MPRIGCPGVMDVGERMGKRLRAGRDERDGELLSLLILGGCFFLGMLSGLFFATLGEASVELSDYLQSYFQAAGGSGAWRPAIWSVIWDLVQWPLASLVLGLTALGVVCVPALLLARGFLLSYSVSLFLRLFGGGGFCAALAVFGVTALLVLPALFAVSCDAFRSSLARLGRYQETAVISLHQKLTMLIPSAGLLAVAAVLQWTVMPALLEAVCARFFVS